MRAVELSRAGTQTGSLTHGHESWKLMPDNNISVHVDQRCGGSSIENFSTLFVNGSGGVVLGCLRGPKAPLEATRGLDVDIEPDHFSPPEQYIFKRHSNRITGLQRAGESLGSRKRDSSVSNAFDPASRILTRASTEQPPWPSLPGAYTVPLGLRDCHEILLVYRRSGWQVRGYQRWIALVVAKDDLDY